MKITTFLTVFSSLLCGQAPPVAQVDHTIAFERDFSKQPIPRFRNKFVVGYDSGHTHLMIWDAKGNDVLNRELALPGAAKVSISDIAISSDGMIAVSASAYSGTGHGSAVIAWLNLRGELIRVVVTNPSAARRLAFAPDGSLWAFGRTFDADLKDVPQYSMLQRYSADGRLIKSVLPRSIFPAGGDAPYTECYLAAADRIAVVSVSAAEWIELSLEGEILGRWPWKTGPGIITTGVALTPNGALFATLINGDSGQLHRYDRSSQSWKVVDTAQARGPRQGLVLLGNDGDTLVVRSKPPGSLAWIRVP
jgi:hypothetical protein